MNVLAGFISDWRTERRFLERWPRGVVTLHSGERTYELEVPASEWPAVERELNEGKVTVELCLARYSSAPR